jgi:hypothetical protein
MAFSLKNGGATHQKCIQIILESQIGRNVKAYIDDVVVKSKKCGDLLDDLRETFDNLHKYKIMLNPKTTRLHGIVLRNRCELEEGGGHRTIATTLNSKRNPEPGKHDGGTQPIHIQVG